MYLDEFGSKSKIFNLSLRITILLNYCTALSENQMYFCFYYNLLPICADCFLNLNSVK